MFSTFSKYGEHWNQIFENFSKKNFQPFFLKDLCIKLLQNMPKRAFFRIFVNLNEFFEKVGAFIYQQVCCVTEEFTKAAHHINKFYSSSMKTSSIFITSLMLSSTSGSNFGFNFRVRCAFK